MNSLIKIIARLHLAELDYDRKKKHADEEDQEEDYLEAEVDSTDTVIPTLTEFFGETLLRRKYSTTSNLNPLPVDAAAKSLQEVEEESVPGTVPSRRNLLLLTSPTRYRRSPQPSKRRTGLNNALSSSSMSIQQRRKEGENYPVNANYSRRKHTTTGAKGHKQYGYRSGRRGVIGQRQQSFVDEPISPVRMVRFQENLNRSNSMTSHATFVLENDKRKPLLVACGFKEAVASFASNSVKTTSKFSKESIIPEDSHTSSTQSPSIPAEPMPPVTKPKHSSEHTSKVLNHIASPKKNAQRQDRRHLAQQRHQQRDAWKDVDIDEPITLLHDYTNESDLLKGPTLTALEGKTASTRIPKDADVREYVSIFGSRPKVIRTPEHRQGTLVSNNDIDYTTAAAEHYLVAARQ